MKFINWERLKANNEYNSKCCDIYYELLGDIKRYGLHPREDWGEIYIGGRSISIKHIDDDKHIMLFNLNANIDKNGRITETSEHSIRIENLTPEELKEKLVELYGF